MNSRRRCSGVNRGVFCNKSIKSVLGLEDPARGATARRPDIVNNQNHYVWEIKSGITDYYLGHQFALSQLKEYLSFLNDPGINPKLYEDRPYVAGSGYNPEELSLAPYWLGYIIIDANDDGTLLYYLDPGTLDEEALVYAVSILSLIPEEAIGGDVIPVDFAPDVELPDVAAGVCL